MTRKVIDGPVRNRERTRKKVLDSVADILKNEGFTGLNIRQIASKANVDRKLIYDYFGGLEGLVKEYLNSRDFWKSNSQLVGEDKEDHGKATSYAVLEKQFDSLMVNEEMRRIITWALCENIKPLRELNNDREILAESFFNNVVGDHFEGKDKNFRAITSILISSIYYMTLINQMNGSTICGIDLQKQEDAEAIKKSLKQIIDWAYS
ncbi:TetR/AcrR family transcriptional regulator [Pedobacter sp. NJ-S-72]